MATHDAKPTPLRFAALVRVSTERQAATGESLRTQRAKIEATVKQLGGTVATWYGGQEHATQGWEKQEIERLLTDARKKARPWDAVIVSNADRWSRDNQANHDGLAVFKAHKVRFFVGSSEYDLYNPEHCLFLEMSAAMGWRSDAVVERARARDEDVRGRSRRGAVVAPEQAAKESLTTDAGESRRGIKRGRDANKCLCFVARGEFEDGVVPSNELTHAGSRGCGRGLRLFWRGR